MAFLEQSNGWYRVVFTHRGKRFAHSLGTQDERTANAVRGGIERTLLQIQQRLLVIPSGSDTKEFILSGGQDAQLNPSPSQTESTSPHLRESLTLEQFQDRYLATIQVGSVEESTLALCKIHFGHFRRTLGSDFPIQKLVHDDLQKHILLRANAKVRRHRKLSAVTIARNWPASEQLGIGAFRREFLRVDFRMRD